MIGGTQVWLLLMLMTFETNEKNLFLQQNENFVKITYVKNIKFIVKWTKFIWKFTQNNSNIYIG